MRHWHRGASVSFDLVVRSACARRLERAALNGRGRCCMSLDVSPSAIRHCVSPVKDVSRRRM